MKEVLELIASVAFRAFIVGPVILISDAAGALGRRYAVVILLLLLAVGMLHRNGAHY